MEPEHEDQNTGAFAPSSADKTEGGTASANENSVRNPRPDEGASWHGTTLRPLRTYQDDVAQALSKDKNPLLVA